MAEHGTFECINSFNASTSLELNFGGSIPHIATFVRDTVHLEEGGYPRVLCMDVAFMTDPQRSLL